MKSVTGVKALSRLTIRVPEGITLAGSISQMSNLLNVSSTLKGISLKEKMAKQSCWTDFCLEPISVKFFVDFRDYFGRFSIFFAGDCINFRILPLQRKSKIGQNNPENRLKLFTETGS